MVRITGWKWPIDVLRAREYDNEPIKTCKIPKAQWRAIRRKNIPRNPSSITLPLNRKTGEELTIYDYNFVESG